MTKRVAYEEGFVMNSRGKKLFTCRWFPLSGASKAQIFLCHGYGMECSGSMSETGTRLASSGYSIYGIDYEGHGRSEGLRGYIPEFDYIVEDSASFFRKICEKENRNLRRYLLGESMGGAVAFSILRLQPEFWDGALLVAPMLKISEDMKPHWILISIFDRLKSLIPTWQIVPKRDIFTMGYQDPAKRKAIKQNPLIFKGRARLKTASELLAKSMDIEERLEEVNVPLFILHGEQDKITDASVSKLLYDRSKSCDKTLKIYENMWHGLLSGETPLHTEIVLSDIISWLDNRS